MVLLGNTQLLLTRSTPVDKQVIKGVLQGEGRLRGRGLADGVAVAAGAWDV